MHSGPDIAPAFSMVLIMFVLFMGFFVTVIGAVVYCMIFSKAGYCWALGLLMFVPIANIITNIIMSLVLAFGDWPVRRELRLLKQQMPKT
jgi:hypothetical protein